MRVFIGKSLLHQAILDKLMQQRRRRVGRAQTLVDPKLVFRHESVHCAVAALSEVDEGVAANSLTIDGVHFQTVNAADFSYADAFADMRAMVSLFCVVELEPHAFTIPLETVAVKMAVS